MSDRVRGRIDLDGDAADAAGAAVVRNWWIPLIGGVISVIIGLWSLFSPAATLGAMVILTGIAFGLQGVVAIVQAFVGAAPGGHRVLWFLYGALSLVASVVAFARPLGTLYALTWLLAFWLAMSGAFQIAGGIASSHGRWFNLIIGTLSLIVGLMLFGRPVDAVVTLAFVFGFTYLVTGISQCAAAFELRSIGKRAGVL